jgi:hypothetical protein
MYIIVDLNEKSCNRCVLARAGRDGLARWEFLRPVESILWDSRDAAERVVKSYQLECQVVILEVEGVQIPQESVLGRVCKMFSLKE